MKWEWTEEGVIIRGIGSEQYDFKFDHINTNELMGYSVQFDRFREIYLILKEAHLAFIHGKADYNECFTNIQNLIAGGTEADIKLTEIAKDISSFFTPKNLYEVFKVDLITFGKFVLDAVQHIKLIHGSPKPN